MSLDSLAASLANTRGQTSPPHGTYSRQPAAQNRHASQPCLAGWLRDELLPVPLSAASCAASASSSLVASAQLFYLKLSAFLAQLLPELPGCRRCLALGFLRCHSAICLCQLASCLCLTAGRQGGAVAPKPSWPAPSPARTHVEINKHAKMTKSKPCVALQNQCKHWPVPSPAWTPDLHLTHQKIQRMKQ